MRRIKLLLLWACKVAGLFRLARRLTRDRLKILCYHGFALEDEASFRPKLFITPHRFNSRLATIRRWGLRVLPLDEAVARLYDASLPSDAIVVTVDDGFHSFSSLAVPALQRFGYPASVYVTSYYVEHANPIFRLAVQYMFWKTRRSQLVLQGVPWSPDRIVDLSNAGEADQVMWAIIEHGERRCNEPQRREITVQLGELLGTPYAELVRSRKLHLMTPVELGALAAADISVELHTHRHVFPPDDRLRAEREIADNRRALGQWLMAASPHHFCYPSGLFEPQQHAWLDAMGVRSSTTCLPGLNSRETPRHSLRRFLDSESIHSLEFEAALSGFSDLARSVRARVVHASRDQPG